MMAIGVVIVDDEKISRDYIKSLIDWDKNGFLLIGEAQSAEEAMNILANNDVGIMLLDVFMPGENGVVLSKRVAELYPSVAMIAISSYDDYDYVCEILKNGAHDYILKHRLNGEVLLSALKATAEKIQKKQNSRTDQQLRYMVEAWLFKSEKDPFAEGMGRMAITIASIAWDKNISDELRIRIVQGILSILEENNDTEQMIAGAYYPPNCFVICTRFKSITSEAEIQSKLCLRNMRNQNNIKLVYNLEFTILNNQIFVEHAKIPEYVKQHVTLMPAIPYDKDNTGKRYIAMTIKQQKRLLAALDEHNEQEVSLLITDIYKSISDSDARTQIIITKELLEILAEVAWQYGIQTDFIFNDKNILERLQDENIQELSAKITELYFQIIREMKNQQIFSGYIEQANRFIEKNYMYDIGLTDAAKHIGISESYLSRIYREKTGMTFVEYLNRVRVNAAKGYMNGGMAIKNVAAACGFKRYNYFFKVFKDYEGVTPKEYIYLNK